MITKTVPINMRVAISYTVKQGSCFEFVGNTLETETETGSEFPNGGKIIVEQILTSEKIIKSNRAGS